MRLERGVAGKVAALALACWLAGCSDFSHHRIGGVRHSVDGEEGPPQPSPLLAIRNPPSTSVDNAVKQATFVPDRAAPIQAPNGQAMQHPLRVLYQRAAQRHATMDSYIFRLKRREVVKGRKMPEEVLLVKVRRQPYSVFVKCLSEPGKGREVIYVEGKYKNQIQVLLPKNDLRSLLGRRHSVALDDPQVRAESRHPITQTGFGSMIDHFGRVVASVEKGDARAGVVKYLGRQKRPEFAQEVEAVRELVPAGDPDLPKGGERLWYFDADSGLPVLRIARDRNGREIEYYCHDHIQWPVRLDDDDFNAEKLWRK
jgi:Protein of unknown function (DUF1571)